MGWNVHHRRRSNPLENEMIYLKFFLLAIISGLYWWGGFAWHNDRRFVLPLVLGVAISYFTSVWWLGFTILPVVGWLCQGYGEKSWLRCLMGDAGARGFWLFMACLLISSPLFFTGHLPLYFYLTYCIVAGILGSTLRNIPEVIGDPIFGAWIGAILFLVK